jgi:hypothetical protein
MQPRNLPEPAEPPAAPEAEVADVADFPDDGAPEVLLPQAASRTLAAATVAIINAVCFTAFPSAEEIPRPNLRSVKRDRLREKRGNRESRKLPVN